MLLLKKYNTFEELSANTDGYIFFYNNERFKSTTTALPLLKSGTKPLLNLILSYYLLDRELFNTSNLSKFPIINPVYFSSLRLRPNIAAAAAIITPRAPRAEVSVPVEGSSRSAVCLVDD